MASVEVRSLDGHIKVTTTMVSSAGTNMVVFETHRGDFPMFPDEARRLAVVLIEQAAAAEQPEAAPWP